jgi:hypothetical protein
MMSIVWRVIGGNREVEKYESICAVLGVKPDKITLILGSNHLNLRLNST